ncbi:HBL160Cp [Eremothecium sinecaudum]|uniref:HBL160Cp n=1 Tax=Eremothecium sinecaudum TaxID=45286 RepID=A0A109UX32_9SACH|nr:HBL160Cp [Eremothecium sinecaudum]AMD18742.1 HBL160Cp [Eremothecium sinecaudum]
MMGETQEAISLEEQEQVQILNFTKCVLSQRTGNFAGLNHSIDGTVFPPISGLTTNRGNKLFQNSTKISQSRMRVDAEEDKVFYSESEHRLLSRKRMKFSTSPQFIVLHEYHDDEGDADNDDYEEMDDYEDLHNLVDVRKLLSPISSLADVATHPAISRTFKSNALRELAQDIMLIIEKEQRSVVSYGRLLEVFLGDYPDALYEDKLALPEYDHRLKLPAEEEDTNAAPSNRKDRRLASKASEKEGTAEDEGEDEDPFFAIPQFKADEKLSVISLKTGENNEDIETTRQLAQIALQRNQEFIRNLQKIRNSIVKANRIRERILMWGKEYAGIPEKDVTIPSALHVVKRGLISATTNHMDEEAEDEDVEDE